MPGRLFAQLSLVLLLCLPLHARENDKLTTFTVPGGYNTYAVATNASGTTIGDYETTAYDQNGDAYISYRGFVRTAKGAITVFEIPDATEVYPTQINDAGVIVGQWFSYGDVNFHGFVRDSDGVITTFDGVPEAKLIAGFFAGLYPVITEYLSYVRNPKGVVTNLDVPGSFYTIALAYSSNGYVTGQYLSDSYDLRAFLYRDGEYSTFRVGEPGANTRSYGVNKSGTVIGSASGAAFTGGFVRTVDGVVTPLSFLPSSINTGGAIVGENFFRAPDGKVTTLNIPYAVSINASNIDSRGLITGSYTDASQAVHGFIFSTEGDDDEHFRGKN